MRAGSGEGCSLYPERNRFDDGCWTIENIFKQEATPVRENDLYPIIPILGINSY